MESKDVKTEFASQKRPLLQTKLAMPRARANPVVRPRLLDQLNTAVSTNNRFHPKLTLITGPAGYGKSTLASQWVEQLNTPTAWLSLDASDNDEARFLAYLFAAIGTVQEEIGEAASARLTTTYLYNDTEAILTALLNDLAVAEQPVVVVLDDYHTIHTDAIHHAMTFILQHMPVQLHLAITSRSQPPLPLALLRGQASLNWIDARDLRFTAAEAAQFLQHTMGLSLSDSQIVELDEQVEGWVTGLQLVALALQDQVTLPAAFSGNQRYLVDYLADQVLDRQSAEVHDFLLKTAVLDRFCIELCDSLLLADGKPARSRALLHHLETANLFLIPLDAERRWYRYHHLFADFLNGRLQQTANPVDIACLHLTTARWYEQNGQPETAVPHALAANEPTYAAQLIASVAQQMLMFGEGSTLRRWVEALPTDVVVAHPRLSLFYAWSLTRTGDFAQAKAIINRVADELDTAQMWGEWSALRARLAVISGDTEVNIRFSQKALHKLPADQHMLRSEVAINLGFSHLQQADWEAARAAFAEAAQNQAHDPGLWAVMFATFYWAQTYERQLQLPQAYEIYQHGLETAATRENGRSPSPAVGFMHVGLGKLLFEWNRLGEAETHLRQALACALRSGDHKMLIYSREALALLLVVMGETAEAEALLHDLEQQTNATGLSTLRANLALLCQDWATVAQWASGIGIQLSDSDDKIQEGAYAYLILVRLHLAQRDFDGVERPLRLLAELAAARHNLHFGVRVQLLQALRLAKMGDGETAVSLFRQLLLQAQAGGCVRLFLNVPDATVGRLLHQCASGSSHVAYAHALLAHFDGDDDGGSETAVVRQPLSPRELEVLTHLAAGLTNREIATQMVVTINTVKAHTRRLYEKLDVNSRTQAVARARALRLLE